MTAGTSPNPFHVFPTIARDILYLLVLPPPGDNTLALKEGPTRHSADILRKGGGPGRVSCIGGATFSHRQNFRTPLKLIQIGKT
ncbi:hypothetical protein PUN28_009822 [Cardiocondyla obscurior]|uniref:Ribosomal protein L2 n=1 Tax=Cardiocondyla obscurior TaxID=286306 RepID=A0AAW2FQN8_9HYME